MRKVYILLVCVLFLSGCATTAYRKSPFLDQRLAQVKNIAVMPMDVGVYKVTAGGVKELMDEDTGRAKSNIKDALYVELGNKTDYRLSFLPEIKQIDDSVQRELFKDALSLYRALDTAISAHTYSLSPWFFPDKAKNFDYSFGREINWISPYAAADALLFIRGQDYHSTGGRIALMVFEALMGFTPYGAGPAHLNAALVDAGTGEVLWYNVFYAQSGYDFRNIDSSKAFVKLLLRDFPRKHK